MRNLVIYFPDIFKPLQFKNEMARIDLPALPALSRLISHAHRSQFNAPNCIETLFKLFAIDVPQHQNYPVAALTYLAEVGDPGDDWCIRIDPVHLQIDRDHLILVDNYMLKIKDKEAYELIASINHEYQDDAFTIEPGSAGHWFIRTETDPCVRTHSINDVIGKNIEPYLMSGERRQYWQSIMNEIQMLLHNHKVNEKRTREGLLPVNSVWLWGEGRLTDFRNRNDAGLWQQVYTSNNMCTGLAKITGLPVHSVPSGFADWIEMNATLGNDDEGRTLVMLGDIYACLRYRDFEQWQFLLQEFEDKWAVPITHALKRGDLDSLEIYDGNGRCYRVTPALLKRWWRRTHSLAQSI